MLTRIEIDGFKTFRDFALDVPPFLVVLGANASGKSNLFDAFAFLARLAGGASVMDAVRADRSQLYELVHRDTPGRRTDLVRFGVEVLLPGEASDAGVRYELDLAVIGEDPLDPEGTERLVIRDERWFLLPHPDEPVTIPSPLVYTPAGDLPEDEAVSRRFPATRAFRPAVSLVAGSGQERLNAVIGAVRQEIAAWRVLAAEPSALRRPDSYDDEDRLAPSGAHLPNALARIARRTATPGRPEGALTDIRNEVATVVPEAWDVRVVEVKSVQTRFVDIGTSDGDFSANAVSDGTLRALALVAALNDPDDTGLLCVEEPENGVYPLRLARLVRLLSGAAATGARRQVIVSTHSPAVLAALDPAAGQALREDAVLMAIASRTRGRGEGISRISVVHPLRGDVSVPLPADLPGPIMSTAQIEEFLGRGVHA